MLDDVEHGGLIIAQICPLVVAAAAAAAFLIIMLISPRRLRRLLLPMMIILLLLLLTFFFFVVFVVFNVDVGGLPAAMRARGLRLRSVPVQPSAAGGARGRKPQVRVPRQPVLETFAVKRVRAPAHCATRKDGDAAITAAFASSPLERRETQFTRGSLAAGTAAQLKATTVENPSGHRRRRRRLHSSLVSFCTSVVVRCK